MKKLLLAAAVAALPAAALAGGEGHIADLARRAVEKGYGATCSLEMMPVERGGYFPCLDFGPYRVVFTYGMVKGYVVQSGRAPFPVLSGPSDNPEFTRAGPWTSDMAARLAIWWNDVIEGGAERKAIQKQTTEEEQAAEAYVKKLMGNEAPKQAKPSMVPDPTPEPISSDAPQPPARTEPTSPIGDDIKQILSH